jgi:translation initiation factor 2B subunit (eIF-2B alpha/beta/delta family)
MAAVWNVCQRWLRRVERGGRPEQAARQTARELTRAQGSAARHAAAFIRNGQAVLTYSASSTVEAALLAAHRNRLRFRVLCSEGRPMYEGRALAQRLAAKGLSIELFTDAALLASLPQASLVLLGCDAVFPDGFVNKAGTHALLRMAERAGVPGYVVADRFKFLPAAAAHGFRTREEKSSEVWKPVNAAGGLRVRNFYFETVPFGACSGLITEQGLRSALAVSKVPQVMGSAEPRRNNRRRRVHPAPQ